MATRPAFYKPVERCDIPGCKAISVGAVLMILDGGKHGSIRRVYCKDHITPTEDNLTGTYQAEVVIFNGKPELPEEEVPDE